MAELTVSCIPPIERLRGKDWEAYVEAESSGDVEEEVPAHEQAEHVVVTGGEPMLHDEIEPLFGALDREGYHVTVETNGTIHREVPIDLVSVSPKLATSTPTAERDPKGDGEWAADHEARRIDYGALCALLEDYEFQLKFVVTGPEDLPEITDLLEQLRERSSATVENGDVVLMPEGTTRAELDRHRETVADLSTEYGFRYTPRIHVDLWDDAPGR